MVGFNDQVLPRANHQLRILQHGHRADQADAGAAGPGDQRDHRPVLHPRRPQQCGDQQDVRCRRSTILPRGPERKTIYADSGLFLLAPNGQDLQLELFDGLLAGVRARRCRRFQRSFFREQMVQVRGISQGFEASRGDTYRGDREMTVCEMQRKYRIVGAGVRAHPPGYIGYASRIAGTGAKTVTVPARSPDARGARGTLLRDDSVAVPGEDGASAGRAGWVNRDGSGWATAGAARRAAAGAARRATAGGAAGATAGRTTDSQPTQRRPEDRPIPQPTHRRPEDRPIAQPGQSPVRRPAAPVAPPGAPGSPTVSTAPRRPATEHRRAPPSTEGVQVVPRNTSVPLRPPRSRRRRTWRRMPPNSTPGRCWRQRPS